MPIAQRLRLGRGQFLERGQRLLGAPFLDDAHYRVQHDDGQDGRGFDIISKQG